MWQGVNSYGHQAIYSNFAGQLTSGVYENDRYPDISGTNVVWFGWTPEGGYGIYSNFAGRLSAEGHVNNDLDWPMTSPAISGTNVVWQQGQGNSGSIYSNFAGQLTSIGLGDLNPDISGTNVVWQRGGDYGDGGVYANFAGELAGRGMNPAISGTNVVWLIPSGSTELQTNFGGAVTGADNWYSFPGHFTVPDISGTTIVWDGWDFSGEGDYEIYMATYTPDTIPAPGAGLLAGLGVGLVGWSRRRGTF